MKKFKKPLILFAVLAIVGAAFFIFSPGGETAVAADAPAFSLTRSDMIRTFSASGVVRSTETKNVFSTQGRPVQEIFADVGDRVEAGDILAQLDMSNIINDIAQTELNILNAERNKSEEERNASGAVTNAQIGLDRARQGLVNAQRDLADAREDAAEPFDAERHDRAVYDAYTNLIRRTQDFEEALAQEADSATQRAVTEARITLERRLSDLDDAKETLQEELDYRPDAFDAIQLQRVIDDARRNLERRREEEVDAEQEYNDETLDFRMSFFSTMEAYDAARAHLDRVGAARDNARRIAYDAQLAYDRARADLVRTRNDYYENRDDRRENIIDSAERAVTNAQNFADDAQRALDRALADLSTTLRTREQQLQDAQRAYDRAVSDRATAEEDFTDANDRRLLNAQRMVTDAQIQLRQAEESLAQALARPSASATAIEIQQLNLARLNTLLEEGTIIAPIGGTVTQANATVGAAATGILFVIEDTESLYVAANVREHSLGDLQVGQSVYVTTEVTGDRVYSAELTFISPRAVSPPGSTSVEFEVNAEIENSDADIRIGMNAFINVVTDTRENVYSVPLSALLSDFSGNFVFARNGDEITQIPVNVGFRTSTHVEIYGGYIREGLTLLSRASDARPVGRR